MKFYLTWLMGPFIFFLSCGGSQLETTVTSPSDTELAEKIQKAISEPVEQTQTAAPTSPALTVPGPEVPGAPGNEGTAPAP